MDTEQHEKMLMDEARLQLIEGADIKRVEVTPDEALVAVEKVKDEEGELKNFVQKELSVFLDEFAIKDYEGCNRDERTLTPTLSARVRSGVDYREEEEVQIRTEEEARRVEFTEVAEKPTEERGGTKSEVGPRPFRGRAKVGRDEIDEAEERSENTRRSAFATSFAQKDAKCSGYISRVIFRVLREERFEQRGGYVGRDGSGRGVVRRGGKPCKRREAVRETLKRAKR